MPTFSERWASFVKERKADEKAAAEAPADGSNDGGPVPQAHHDPAADSTPPRATPAAAAPSAVAQTPRGTSSWRDRVSSFFEGAPALRSSTPPPLVGSSSRLDEADALALQPGNLLSRLVRHHCGERHTCLREAAVLSRAGRGADLRVRVLSFLSSYAPADLSDESDPAASPTRHHHSQRTLRAIDGLIAADVPTEYALEKLRAAYRAGGAGSTHVEAGGSWTALEDRRWSTLLAPLMPKKPETPQSASSTVAKVISGPSINTRGHTGGGQVDRRPEGDADAQWFTYHGEAAAVDHATLRVHYRQGPGLHPAMPVADGGDEDTASDAFVAQLLGTGLTREALLLATAGAAAPDAACATIVPPAGFDDDDWSSAVSTSVCNRSVSSHAGLSLHADFHTR